MTRYVVTDPNGRVVFSHHVKDVALKAAQEDADHGGRDMAVRWYDDTARIDEVLVVSPVPVVVEPFPGLNVPGWP